MGPSLRVVLTSELAVVLARYYTITVLYCTVLYCTLQVHPRPHVRAGHRVSLRHVYSAARHVSVGKGAVCRDNTDVCTGAVDNLVVDNAVDVVADVPPLGDGHQPHVESAGVRGG